MPAPLITTRHDFTSCAAAVGLRRAVYAARGAHVLARLHEGRSEANAIFAGTARADESTNDGKDQDESVEHGDSLSSGDDGVEAKGTRTIEPVVGVGKVTVTS